ncbi:type II toxin-antitoxin system Phd/YefM family antitoxin [Leptospira alstonii]|uniref:Antitoxin n=2 Tax=Leptospira alstonii TaxID=28452 RepID=M6CYQ7_9LEPT|nr:type II toxin-antitoxin system Phd/YefM family antitoxin [Leptospira alstonii]EMJ96829.1 prevent-host-death family protein [Leptospira alstonii serovar Sichuan str. 79601]EQA80002.1 prevent-host-death family protein [Leptospira alstonii serovar Pingchang str. 80-412]
MKISATDFKTKCLSLMDLVQSKHTEIIITKHGKPIAKLVPTGDDGIKSPIGYLKGKIKTESDIVEKLGVSWNFEK